MFQKKKSACILVIVIAVVSGCQSTLAFVPSATPLPSVSTPTSTVTLTPSFTPAPSSTFTLTPTVTETPTITLTPTITETPTITPSPTFALPEGLVKEQSNCRYGPGKAYLYSAGLYTGDHGKIGGRNYSGAWLYFRPDTVGRYCWVAASQVNVTSGNVMALPVQPIRLPHSVLYKSPNNIRATRKGDKVTVTWDAVWMTEDDNRGYMIEANVCQDGAYFPIAIASMEPKIEIRDQKGCNSKSNGRLYTVEKHGYTDPVNIPWP
ncbi:MAG TPA: hypothetical protein VMT46_08045 [Anaerolineaceae bacterium]|nr:hypothetical protein [Anaerolineaceae bacterium]